MKKVAEIISIKDNIAKVKVERSSMCDGCTAKDKDGKCSCSHMSLTGNIETFVSDAVCNIPVSEGDTVIVETSDSKVLTNAFIVFILPIAVFIVGYFLTLYFTNSDVIAFVSAVAAILASFIILTVVEKKRKKSGPDITVIEVISEKISN